MWNGRSARDSGLTIVLFGCFNSILRSVNLISWDAASNQKRSEDDIQCFLSVRATLIKMCKTGFAGNFAALIELLFRKVLPNLPLPLWFFSANLPIHVVSIDLSGQISLFLSKIGVFRILASASLESRAGTLRAAQLDLVWRAGNSEKRNLTKQSPWANRAISDVSSAQLRVKPNRA